jgi:hypothetical protein
MKSGTFARSQRASERVEVSVGGVSPLLAEYVDEQLPSQRDLLLQTLLHLPRLASTDGTVSVAAALKEVAFLRDVRHRELSPFRDMARPPTQRLTIKDLRVQQVASLDAQPVVSHFHYLRSARRHSVNIAATARDRIVALCCISVFDLPHIGAELPLVAEEDVRVVSRVFAFDWAPRNTISFLLARVKEFVKARLLLTYVDPNLGFSGASYRAANWFYLGKETGTRYAYVAGRYVTERELLARRDEALEVEYSRMPLLPLKLFAFTRDDEFVASVAEKAIVVKRPQLQ